MADQKFDVVSYAKAHSGKSNPNKQVKEATSPAAAAAPAAPAPSAPKTEPVPAPQAPAPAPPSAPANPEPKVKKSKKAKQPAPAGGKTPAASEKQGKETSPKTQESKTKAETAEEAVPVESKKKEVLPLKTLVRQWALAYCIAAPAHLADLWTRITHFKYTPTEDSVLGDNQHGLMAAYRQAATVFSINALVERGHTTIDILFFSNRDYGITENLRSFLRKRTTEQVTFNLIGDQVVPSDLTRRFPTGHVASGTACLVVDVYHDNVDSPTKPMDIKTFERYGYQDSVWVGHIFEGRFGVVDTSCWMRDDEDMVIWYADKVNLAYPSHPACDALVKPTATGKTASAVLHSYSIGETVVFRVMIISKSPIRISPKQLDQQKSLWLPTEIPDYKDLPSVYRLLPGWARSLLPVGKIRIWIKSAHLATLSAELASKGRSNWTFASYQQVVKRVLDDDAEFMQLERAFPAELDGYRHVLALVSFAHRAKEDTDLLIATGDAAGGHLSQYEAARRNIATPTDPVEFSKVFAIGGWLLAAVSLWAIIQYWRLRRASVAEALGPKPDKGLMAVCKEAASELAERTADTFVVLEGQWNDTAMKQVKKGDMWYTIVWLWAQRPGPANAKLATRILRLVQSIKDRAKNHLPHRVAARIAHSAIDKMANGMERPVLCGKAAAATVAGAAMTPFAIGAAANIFASPLIEEGAKHLFDNAWWKFCTSTICATFDMMNYGPRANWGLFTWHMVFHNVCSWLPLKYAAPIHMFYNACARPLGYGTMSSPLGQVVMPALAGLAATIRDTRYPEYWGTQVSSHKMVTEFDNHHYHSATEDGHLAEVFYAGTLGTDQSFVRAMDARPVVPPVLDPRVVMTQLPKTIHEQKSEVDGYWRAIYHNAPMFKPAKSQHNMLCVAMYRLRKQVELPVPYIWDVAYTAFTRIPYIVSPTYTNAHANWEFAEVCHIFDNMLELNLVPTAPVKEHLYKISEQYEWWSQQDSFEFWLMHTEPSKRERYLSARKMNITNPVTLTDKRLTQVQVNIKTDEVLLKVGNPKQNGFIPRPIHAVDPCVVVTLGPAIYEATARLKDALNFNWSADVFGYKIYLKFAAGSTDKQLSLWMTEFRNHVGSAIIIFVAGDDSLVGVKSPGNLIYWLTGDLTACDRSIGPEALSAEWQVLADLLVPHEVIEAMIVSAGATLRCSLNDKNSEAFFLTRPLERNTGGVDTTFGNSVCVLLAWHLVMLELVANRELLKPDIEDLQKAFTRFGLTMKLKLNRDEEYGFAPEFLKGWWLPYDCAAGRATWWTPLPSRLLKLTKTIRDPRLTYKAYGVTTLEAGLKCHLASVAAGMLPFALAPPLAAIYVHWSKMNPTNKPMKALDEDYYQGKTLASDEAPDLDLDEFYKAVENRYKLDRRVATEFFTVIARLSVGDVFYHPGWNALATDYA